MKSLSFRYDDPLLTVGGLIGPVLAVAGGWAALPPWVAALFGMTFFILMARLARLHLSQSAPDVTAEAAADDGPDDATSVSDLDRIAAVISAAAGGDLDARVFPAVADPAVARLGHDLNTLLDITDAYLRESYGSLRAVAAGRTHRRILPDGMHGDFGRAAGTITRAMEGIGAEVAELRSQTDRFESKALGAYSEVAAASHQLRLTAEGLSEASQTASTKTDGVAQRSGEATERVVEAAEIAGELMRWMETVGERSTRTNAVSQQALGESKNAERSIAELTQAAQAITEVTRLIQDVADKINLLAVNAAVEAARAGEAGKGFAVVASEIRTLSVETGHNSEAIRTKIGEVQQGVKSATDSLGLVGATIGQLVQIAGSVEESVASHKLRFDDLVQQVGAAADGARQISSLAADLSETVRPVHDASRDVRDAAAELDDRAESMRLELQAYLEAAKRAA